MAAIASVMPSIGWAGSSASGFASPPVDPVRITAKPVCRLLTPPFQWFTDELPVGVWAAANHGGSLLDNMGLEKVVCHYEGASIDILQPSFQTFADANGEPVTYFGWWTRLKHDGRHGHAQVYFEAVPKDPAMQRRVIGPYQFSPQPAPHDYSIEVAATPAQITGERYKTLKTAWEYLKSVSAMNPLITITEAGTYDIAGPNGFWLGATASVANGYCTVTATAPVTLAKPAPAPGADVMPFRPLVNASHWRGRNLTFDFIWSSEYYQEVTDTRQCWFDGVNLTNSAGRDSLWRKTTRNTLSQLLRGNPWVTECHISKVWNIGQKASLFRGCAINECWGDAFNHVDCTIGNIVEDWDSSWYRERIPALTVGYAGPSATATLESSGYKTFTAKENGSVVSTFTVNNTLANWSAGTNYHVSNVVDWLNGLPGWSATLLDDTRAAHVLELGTGVPGAPFGAQNVKGKTLTLHTAFDIHADWWQQQHTGGVADENKAIADNRTSNFEGQFFLWGGDAGMKDVIAVNNAFGMKRIGGVHNPAQMATQFSRAMSHVVVGHNSFVGQGWLFRMDLPPVFDPDARCLFANNAMRSAAWVGGGPDADLVLKDNHLNAGSAVPAGSTGSTTGGNEASLYADADGGDFSPRGALLENPKVPVVKYDRAGKARAAIMPVGAM